MPHSLYLDPHDLFGLAWEWESFTAWHWDTLRRVRGKAPDLSVHGEVFSPFSQLCEAVGVEETLVALRGDPGRVKAALEALGAGTVELMAGHVAAGADAVLVSSAYAGAGLISTRRYREFVLPFEARVVSGFKARCPGTPVYTHTCGRIGDRLELVAETGTDGIDTLDPPPLGDVELADAKRRVGGRLFLKGNVDPVGTVLLGTPEAVLADARRRTVGDPQVHRLRRPPGDDEPVESGELQLGSPPPARLPFTVSVGEGRLGRHGEPVGPGQRNAVQRTGRDNHHILRTERVDARLRQMAPQAERRHQLPRRLRLELTQGETPP